MVNRKGELKRGPSLTCRRGSSWVFEKDSVPLGFFEKSFPAVEPLEVSLFEKFPEGSHRDMDGSSGGQGEPLRTGLKGMKPRLSG